VGKDKKTVRVSALVRLVEREVGDLLKILAVAGKQGQVMLKGCCGNQDIQIPDLLTNAPGIVSPEYGQSVP
jgi:hypothetical protein